MIQRGDAKLSELRRTVQALHHCMLNKRTNTTSKWLHQYLSVDLRVLIDKSGADYWHGSLHRPLECDSWSSSTDVLPSLLSLQETGLKALSLVSKNSEQIASSMPFLYPIVTIVFYENTLDHLEMSVSKSQE